MRELRCPKCGKVFSVEQSDYDSILAQVRTDEFQRQVTSQVEAQRSVFKEKIENYKQGFAVEKKDIELVTNTGETKIPVGRIWKTTATGAGWAVDTGGSGGGSGSGVEIVQDESQAEIIVINTCAFINDAKEESINTIIEMGNYKKEGNCKYNPFYFEIIIKN